MPNNEEILGAAMKLVRMLKTHRYTVAPEMGIKLFKAWDKPPRGPTSRSSLWMYVSELFIATEKSSICRDEKINGDNGWSTLSRHVEVQRCNGDHESMLRADNFSTYSHLIGQIINEENADVSKQ